MNPVTGMTIVVARLTKSNKAFNCTFEDFEAMVKESEEAVSEFISEYELVKVNDHKSIFMCNCSDMEAFEAMMSSPEMKEWDKENNCVDIVYSLEKIN